MNLGGVAVVAGELVDVLTGDAQRLHDVLDSRVLDRVEALVLIGEDRRADRHQTQDEEELPREVLRLIDDQMLHQLGRGLAPPDIRQDLPPVIGEALDLRESCMTPSAPPAAEEAVVGLNRRLDAQLMRSRTDVVLEDPSIRDEPMVRLRLDQTLRAVQSQDGLP